MTFKDIFKNAWTKAGLIDFCNDLNIYCASSWNKDQLTDAIFENSSIEQITRCMKKEDCKHLADCLKLQYSTKDSVHTLKTLIIQQFNNEIGPLQNESPSKNSNNFFIGLAIDAYKKSGVLNKCKSDSYQIGSILQSKFGYQSIYLKDHEVTSQNIQKTITNLQSKIKSNSKVIVYFSGHGNKDSWTIFNNHKNEQAYTTKSISNMIESLHAHHLLLISDSCHALGVAASRNANNRKQMQDNSRPLNYWETLEVDTCRVFLAATGNNEAWDGVFAKHFIKVLSNTNRPLDIDGVVSQVRMSMHNDNDIEEGSYQVPQLRQIDTQSTGVFVFLPIK